MLNSPILCAKEICKSFSGKMILDHLSVSVFSGESVAIIGGSGGGKTTLLHILGALLKPDSGEITFLGQSFSPSNSEKLLRNSIGFLLQTHFFLEDLTVLENLQFPQSISGKKSSFVEIKQLLDMLHLTPTLHSPVHMLSGGERQRVGFARMLLNDPILLLADEPTGNLDPENTILIHNILLQQSREKKKSVVLVTHDIEFACMCDHVFYLHDGKLSPYG